MKHDMIQVFGAKENNLKNINLEIPKNKLTTTLYRVTLLLCKTVFGARG
jgi:excinuclease UvrABC ATPase subunit